MTGALALDDADRAALSGARGGAVKTAMEIVTKLGEWMGATALLDIERAHIDGCLYTGLAGVDFAQRLADAGGKVAVPTTLNVSSLDLLHPDLYRGDAEAASLSRRQMDAYVAMGCEPTWTCAPYQLPDRPRFGQQIAWGESNAIVFANSVLGARTERYGDFADIACALTGRAPAAGLHLRENRTASLVVDVGDLPNEVLVDERGFGVLGHWLGRVAGSRVAAIVGVLDATEDQLKVLGAAAASSGAVGLFHVVGVTPEAPTLDAVVVNEAAVETVVVTPSAMRHAAADLSHGASENLGAVSLGTPHYSSKQLERLIGLIAGRDLAVPMYVSTGRNVTAEAPSLITALEQLGVTIVTDTCTYFTPIIGNISGCVLTDSAKWAYYAPGNIGVDVAYGSTAECVESAVTGRLEVAGW